MNIIQKKDLSDYGIATVNNGVTEQQIEIMERGFLILIFGIEGAKKIYENLMSENENFTLENDFFKGDRILFPGLIALLSVQCSLHLISKGRVSVGREASGKTATSARLSKREENEVIQALAWEVKHMVHSLKNYLSDTKKNPLDLKVYLTPEINQYQKNLSGKMPQNRF